MIGLWLALACSAPAPVEAAVLAANPLHSIDRDIDRTPFTGQVEQLRGTGGYQYVRVSGRWAVGLNKDLAVDDHIEVRPVGEAHAFSSRTGHHYDTLLFAVLSPSAAAGGE